MRSSGNCAVGNESRLIVRTDLSVRVRSSDYGLVVAEKITSHLRNELRIGSRNRWETR